MFYTYNIVNTCGSKIADIQLRLLVYLYTWESEGSKLKIIVRALNQREAIGSGADAAALI